MRRIVLATAALMVLAFAAPATAKVIPSQIDVTEEGGVLRVLVTMEGMEEIGRAHV